MKIFLLISIVLIGCNNQNDKKIKKELTNPKWIEIKKNQDSLTFEEVLELTKSEAIQKYGNPFSQEQFILDDLQGEFRIGLYNFFNKKERLSESILIDEVTWEKDKNTWITAWYQVIQNTTIPKDTVIWKKGTDF